MYLLILFMLYFNENIFELGRKFGEDIIFGFIMIMMLVCWSWELERIFFSVFWLGLLLYLFIIIIILFVFVLSIEKNLEGFSLKLFGSRLW